MEGPGGEMAGGAPMAAAWIASATWYATTPRKSSSLFPGVTADEETGGGPRMSVCAADDGPGDPEEGSIADTGDKNGNTQQLRP